MAEVTVRRVVAVAAVAGALVGGAVAGGVAAASTNGDAPASNSGSSGSVGTTRVVRADLSTTVQVGGSIGYDGSYAVAFPTGASAQQVAQAEQAVTGDEQGLSADETADRDAITSDDQAISAAQANVNTATSTLSSDQATETKDCLGKGASTPACTQDAQKVAQDQTQLTQAQQQLTAAQATAQRDRDQNQSKLASDQSKLQGDQSALAALQATAINPGTAYTELPKVGEIIGQDQTVYSLNGVPVPLLYGALAQYRAFYVGMPDGADVGQLTHDLIALGYGAGLVQSNHYSAATAAAVERWQQARGIPATGSILLGEVVFEPGPIRITSVTPSVGQAAGPGTIVDATSTRPIVTVDLNVTQEYLVKPGDAVSIVLPDGVSTVGGHVETVGNVAVCPGGGGNGQGNGTPGASESADQTPCSSSGGGNSSTPTVTVTITLDSTPPGATLDQAPVNVNITSDRVDNVLAVPVNALLALQGGGFGVDVVSGGVSRLVGVTTGLYSSTLVQISGVGISAGTLVEVPSS